MPVIIRIYRKPTNPDPAVILGIEAMHLVLATTLDDLTNQLYETLDLGNKERYLWTQTYAPITEAEQVVTSWTLDLATALANAWDGLKLERTQRLACSELLTKAEARIRNLERELANMAADFETAKRLVSSAGRDPYL